MTTHLSLQRMLLPTVQVSDLTTGSITLPSALSSGYPATNFESIASTTLSTTESGVIFTNIPITYKHLQLRMMFRGNGTGGVNGGLKGTFINFNGDSSTTVSNHAIYGDTSSVIGNYQSDTRINFVPQTIPSASTGANIYGVIIMDILDYSDPSKYTTIKAFTGCPTNTSGQIGLVSACYFAKSVITKIQVGSNEPSIAYSSFALYGVK